ncbi:RagB/SusD family nutrient uptake outer membrane protein [Chitinophaga filiformis]|uniref:RagB/SusD family nutrient uptake outer membrane protein n=1 Tax=Chitinophaga filiformis TaxID=104663 RepID=A0ABY4HXH9_CHIFI|nr:RagB/SusD family nutrient uptake outer membrane protein [Chitinophaga filiformis]UPK67869.1 RagB/SusD family nutrient uptake outer membrane protein [Chitinophaga filiformis]
MPHYRTYYFILLLMMITSCKKLITVNAPSDEIPAGSVYSNEALADAAVADLYYSLSSYFASNILPVINGMTADELNTFNGTYLRYVNNAILPTDPPLLSSWREIYKVIYGANAVLEGLATSGGLSAEKARQLKGEAVFMRAFCYYYLVNCWGDVPLLTTTDVNQTALAPRTGVDSVYTQIISDLNYASQLLPAYYSTGEKVRANRWAAIALLARVQLQRGNWEEAIVQASQVINSGAYTPLIPADSVFLRNSRPAILQIWRNEGYTFLGQTFLPAEGSFSFYPFTEDFMQSFDPADKRKASWTRSFMYGGATYYNCYKYHNRTAAVTGKEEYLMVLRIEEQYLIRAEAFAHLSNTRDAIADLNVLRARAGLPALSDTIIRDSCLSLVERERRMELFTEWGDRWFSLRRTGRLDQVMSALKPGWKSTAALYPIPQEERNRNPHLSQNNGYQ